MENTIKKLNKIVKEMDMIVSRTARNYKFYMSEGKTKHAINEIGALRGAIYMAEAAGVKVPEYYYDMVSDASEMLEE